MGYKDPEVMKEKARQYYVANKERLREKYLANKDVKTEKFRAYYRENREMLLQRNRAYCLENKEKVNAQRAAYRNQESSKEKSREWRLLNKERLKAKTREHYEANKNIRRKWTLKKKYGITISEHDALFASQDKCCAICKTASARNWDTDHCHTSGQVRGILCHQCNLMLGAARDNPDVLEAGIEYLKNFLASEKREAA